MDFLRPDQSGLKGSASLIVDVIVEKNDRLTVEVVVRGPRICKTETDYKTLKVIGHCSDFEIKTLHRFSSLSEIIL